jgi:sigma-B regulation protein RsbU (phosphoserine phosphatase)
MKPLLASLKEVWRRLSWLDVVCSAIVVAGLLVELLRVSGGVFSFLEYLAVLAGLYLVLRFIGWWRNRLLWSLRNRLIVAYLFIAVVPILSIVILVVLAAGVLYSQLGAYLLYEDIHGRVELVADIAHHIAIAHETLPPKITESESELVLAAESHAIHDRELPGLEISFSNDLPLLQKVAGEGKDSFAGLIQEPSKEGESLSLISLRTIPERKEPRVVVLRVPIAELRHKQGTNDQLVPSEFLNTIAPDLGVIQLYLMEKYEGTAPPGVLYTSGEKKYRVAGRVVASSRTLQAPLFWFDSPVNVVSRLDSVFVARDGAVDPARPLLAVSNARPSRLNARIFTSLGELRGTYVIFFVLVGIVFLLIEAIAWTTGIVLTRRITRAVSDLYGATQFVQGGDFSHRIKVERMDQLGALGESFNQMIGSIGTLIEEQNKRQRLENEISIAREVQNQLFPSALPSVPGVEIEAICKAARSVSGDYYDFIQLSPTHVAIAIADISGKGISAALLMASLQAALRSQALTEGSESISTADLVARLNKHLVHNTGDDRFATFFIAVYDSATRTLRYTNAGHLPSFLLCNGSSHLLDKGGMVLGVLDDYVYEQGVLQVAPDSLLVGYSDGLVEPENVYGEEFGITRLKEAAIRVQNAKPLMVAESLMAAAEEWAGTPEQADDMTVIVTRLR